MPLLRGRAVLRGHYALGGGAHSEPSSGDDGVDGGARDGPRHGVRDGAREDTHATSDTPSGWRGRFVGPRAALAPRGGRFLLAEAGVHRLRELGLDGRPLGHTGSEGDLPGYFRTPRALACDADALYVADAGNHRVQKLGGHTLPAPPLSSVCSCGAVRGVGFAHGGKRPDLWRPAGLAVCEEGAHANTLFVSDGHDRVVAFGTEWLEARFSIGRTGSLPGLFVDPQGLALLGAAELLVCDCGNDRVQGFSLRTAGKAPPTRTIPACAAAGTADGADDGADDATGRRDGAFRLRAPRAIAAADGLLFVADGGGKLTSRIVVLTCEGLPLQLLTLCGRICGLCLTPHPSASRRDFRRRRLIAVDALRQAVRVFPVRESAAHAALALARSARRKIGGSGLGVAVAPEWASAAEPSAAAVGAGAARPSALGGKTGGRARWAAMGHEFKAEAALAAWRVPQPKAAAAAVGVRRPCERTSCTAADASEAVAAPPVPLAPKTGRVRWAHMGGELRAASNAVPPAGVPPRAAHAARPHVLRPSEGSAVARPVADPVTRRAPTNRPAEARATHDTRAVAGNASRWATLGTELREGRQAPAVSWAWGEAFSVATQAATRPAAPRMRVVR